MRFDALLTLLLLLGFSTLRIDACTDILVTPGASVDGSAMIAYNADSPTLFGYIYHYPASTYGTGTMRQVYDWDSGVYLGEIPEAAATYNVIGNTNEHGLVIGESTFGGVAVLAMNQSGAILDYGSLIYMTLQRSKTVVEAIHTMVGLMDTYGYYSAGESLSLADHSGQVWMMEMIGRGSDYYVHGKRKMGAVWVAVRIPDGSVAAHANHARITTFPRDDPDNCLYAPDVVDVAIHYGLYPADADPLEFSFSDIYNPLDFVGARQGEARVWSLFSQIADDDGAFQNQYEKYASGMDLNNRMPLFIQPFHQLSVRDIIHLFSSHYEGTTLDGSLDVGAGLFASPYRPRPLVWEYQDSNSTNNDRWSGRYHNERMVATVKTGFSMLAQIRTHLPAALSVVSWYSLDDSSTSPRVPVFSSSRQVASPYAGRGSQDGVVTPLLKLSLDKAFWIQNMVSNWVYSRYQDIYPVVRSKIDAVQEDFEELVEIVDERALQLYFERGSDAAVAFVTQFSVNAGNKLHDIWTEFYGELFVRFRDFYTIIPGDNALGAIAREPGLSEPVKRRIISETKDHYRVMEERRTPKAHQYRGESLKEFKPRPVLLSTPVEEEK